MPPKKLEIPARKHHKVEGNLHSSKAIVSDPASANSDGVSFRYLSPFFPKVGGPRSVRRFAGASTRLELKTSASTKGEHESEWKTAPEKDLTLFAIRLALLERIASNVGALAFIWATVVILSAYATTLEGIDFLFVTVILVMEGARIFSRSHELEWQHQDAATISIMSGAYEKGSDALVQSTRLVRRVLSRLANTPGAGRVATSKSLDPLRQSPLHHDVHRSEKIKTLHNSFKRTWSFSRVPLVPTTIDFTAKHVSRILYWIQLSSAMLSIVLAALRLFRSRISTKTDEADAGSNQTAALIVFYSLTAFEALVFLLERAYWRYQISVKCIIREVNERCGLPKGDLQITRRFFYDVYSKCLTQSIFEGLKMDMEDYALTWLQSDVASEQLGGLRLLFSLSSNSESSLDTLRTISIRQGAVERLLEMITWKNAEEQEIRRIAADILCKLVKHNRNCTIRVAAISGSLEGVCGLLSHDHLESDATGHMMNSPEYIRQAGSAVITEKNVATHIVGLRILKHLAKDPLNCGKIGTTRGLLPRLISFTDTDQKMLRNPEEPKDRISLLKNSLELLTLLAGSRGTTGKMLRAGIAKIVYTFSNLRNILEFGEAHIRLQELATNILSSLAMDEEVREAMGRTGGIMVALWRVFSKERGDGDMRQLKLAVKAGEALTLLALRNEKNCVRMLGLKVRQGKSGGGGDVVEALLEILGDWEMGTMAMRILRSFCEYMPGLQACKERIASCAPRIVKLALLESRHGRPQEAAIGLAAQAVAYADDKTMQRLFSQSMPMEELAARLVRLLEYHPSPSTTLPRIRRFCVELSMALADRGGAAFLGACNAHNFPYHLQRIADSTSDVENYYTFSGAVGVTPHSVPMADLADAAIAKLDPMHELPL